MERDKTKEMRTRQGLAVWELNEVTGKVSLAEYKLGSIFISVTATSSETRENFVLIEKPNCKYFTALNKHNANRKAVEILKTKPQ